MRIKIMHNIKHIYVSVQLKGRVYANLLENISNISLLLVETLVCAAILWDIGTLLV